MAFVTRKIKLTFTLGKGSFGDSGGDTISISDLRVSAKIIKAGGNAMSTMQMQVYGMTLSHMNQLSTLGMVPTLERKNTVTLDAGDDQSGMGTVFIGQITNAWGDFKGAPNVPFQVQAHTGSFDAIVPVAPSSFKGATDVATIMSSLATKMGLTFENNGVQVKLADPYFSGSARDQVLACTKAAGIKSIIDVNKLAIWPAGKSRDGQVPLISKDTGMIGYPSYTSNGIHIQKLFTPDVGFGSKIKVQSDLKPANGEWIIYSMTHDLESELPNGKWQTELDASPPGFTVVA